MGFLAPAFLFGALAAGLPLYLHLLRRNTSTPLPFSSLMFFELRPPNATQRKRLRHWLLLALRLALVLLLASAFAEPYVNKLVIGAGGGSGGRHGNRAPGQALVGVDLAQVGQLVLLVLPRGPVDEGHGRARHVKSDGRRDGQADQQAREHAIRRAAGLRA